MPNIELEHVNITVSDPDKTAALLGSLFGWQVRWSGPSMTNGYTVHVGTKNSYVALYTPQSGTPVKITDINHIAVVVDDLDNVEKNIRAAGLEPYNYGDYEPGRRFYFGDPDGIEYEVVSYA